VINNDKDAVLNKWKSDFEKLFSNNNTRTIPENINVNLQDDLVLSELNGAIIREEIRKAVEYSKLRKAAGYDEIPAEVLKIDTAVDLLYTICNGCFELMKVPGQWTTGIVNPILKPGTTDKRYSCKLPWHHFGFGT